MVTALEKAFIKVPDSKTLEAQIAATQAEVDALEVVVDAIDDRVTAIENA